MTQIHISDASEFEVTLKNNLKQMYPKLSEGRLNAFLSFGVECFKLGTDFSKGVLVMPILSKDDEVLKG